MSLPWLKSNIECLWLQYCADNVVQYCLEIPCQYIFYGDTQMSLPSLQCCADNVVIPVSRAYACMRVSKCNQT